jgi:hypothetical protein
MSRPATCLASSNRSLCEWLLCARSSPCGCRRFLDFTQLNVAVKPIDPDPHRPPRRQGRYENPPPLRTCAALSFPAVLSGNPRNPRKYALRQRTEFCFVATVVDNPVCNRNGRTSTRHPGFRACETTEPNPSRETAANCGRRLRRRN